MVTQIASVRNPVVCADTRLLRSVASNRKIGARRALCLRRHRNGSRWPPERIVGGT